MEPFLTDSKYLDFLILKPAKPRKTVIAKVCAKKSGVELGDVNWYAPWRQYCFFPCPETIFSIECLKDIEAFIDWLDLNR